MCWIHGLSRAFRAGWRATLRTSSTARLVDGCRNTSSRPYKYILLIAHREAHPNNAVLVIFGICQVCLEPRSSSLNHGLLSMVRAVCQVLVSDED